MVPCAGWMAKSPFTTVQCQYNNEESRLDPKLFDIQSYDDPPHSPAATPHHRVGELPVGGCAPKYEGHVIPDYRWPSLKSASSH